MKPTVLLLSTYPIAEPRHGGQIRLAHIGKALSDAGWHVESLAVYEPGVYGSSQLGARDIPLPLSSPYLKFNGREVPLISDLLTGDYASADDGGFNTILKRLPSTIDAILVEQPWLWPLAVKIRKLPQYSNVILIYGSENIEAPLKKDILDSYKVADTEEVISKIKILEKSAASQADITVAVTRSDLDTLTSWGAKNTVLAPNGVTTTKINQKTINKWKNRLPQEPWLLYVASAHPPNFTEFTRCVGESLACIPPTSRLVVAGSVCEHIYQKLSATRWHSINLSRLELVFVIPDEDLMALKMLAHAFILPIPHGGGSNIKTAEALYSGAYVIGTKEAFRGFEEFTNLPEVFVSNNPEEFQVNIKSVLNSAPMAPEKESPMKNKLLWQACLAPFIDELQTVFNGWVNDE